MRPIQRWLAAAAFVLVPELAFAQAVQAIVVASCGTPPLTYTAGQAFPLTQDTTGKLCTSGVGGGGSIVIASGKTFTVNNTLTLAGTDGTTMTFPATSASIARIDAAQSFTGLQTFSTGASIASGQTLDWVSDLFLGRRGAASLTHGAADAASPVAQTIGFQGSRAGTDSNVGGATATINPSLGTGTGTPANIVLKGAVGATTGTGTQTASAALTVAGVVNGQLPSIVLGSAAIATNATDGFLYLVSGAGTPTGTPTTNTGRVPMYVDTTNSQLWMFLAGAWKQPKTPAGAATVTWQ